MDADSSWTARLSSASRRYQAALQSRSDMFMGFDENDVEEDIREEFLCPFCSDYFDIVGLCCHIDEDHPMEAKNGVCPVCALRVGVDMVAHITLQHGNIFKMQRKRKSRKGGSYSTLSLLRKELREGNLQSLFGGSQCILSSSNAAPDPLLSSFISPLSNESMSSQSHTHIETRSSKKGSDETVPKRILLNIAQVFVNELISQDSAQYCTSLRDTVPLLFFIHVETPTMSVKDKEEKTKRCEFIQGLLMSTILDDDL